MVWAFLLLVFLPQAFAESNFDPSHFNKTQAQCSYIDLRNPVLGPVRNQFDSYWCYAFVATDLISYKTGQRVSAMDVGLRTLQDRGWVGRMGSWFEYGDSSKGGFISDAIQAAGKHGVCLESAMPESNSADVESAGMLAELFLDFNSFKKTSFGLLGTLCDPVASLPRLTGGDFFRIFASSSDLSDFEENLRKRACGNERIPPQKFSFQDWSLEPDKTKTHYMTDEIDRQLEAKNIVGIDYDGGLIEPRKVPYSFRDKTYALYGNHDSTIAGRRFQDGKCEYLVRGTWGPRCADYAKGFQCDAGNLWIPEDQLRQSLASITYMR